MNAGRADCLICFLKKSTAVGYRLNTAYPLPFQNNPPGRAANRLRRRDIPPGVQMAAMCSSGFHFIFLTSLRCTFYIPFLGLEGTKFFEFLKIGGRRKFHFFSGSGVGETQIGRMEFQLARCRAGSVEAVSNDWNSEPVFRCGMHA